MRTRFQTLKVVGFLLATGLVSGQAMAQSNGSATADTFATLLKPITLAKTSDLNFGLLLASTGTVTINANDGTRSTQGGIVSSTSGPAPTRASFAVSGLPATTYSISAPALTVELKNTDTTITQTLVVTLSGVHALSKGATNATTAAAGTGSAGTLDANGNDTLGVGGSLPLSLTTPVGNYANAAGIALTVQYN
jgi:hypothetical protein